MSTETEHLVLVELGEPELEIEELSSTDSPKDPREKDMTTDL